MWHMCHIGGVVMEPAFSTDDASVQIFLGDCRESMRQMPEASINCCVTSPPYWGLRDYGCDGQIGLEKRIEDYVDKIVEVFREVRRVLRDDGTLWLNLGDSYNAGTTAASQPSKSADVGGWTTRSGDVAGAKRCNAIGLKPKDLCGIPWRVAFALQADGWWLRQDIIWHKPNPMPESVTDRCTKAHEYIFLLSKSAKYHYDSVAMREPAAKGSAGSSFFTGKTALHQGGRSSTAARDESDMRNRRSVWTVATKPYSGAHFATFPPDLIYPCILAGCPEAGVVLDPFSGSGTTGEVCVMHGRRYVGCELNPEYVELSRSRIGAAMERLELPLFDGSQRTIGGLP